MSNTEFYKKIDFFINYYFFYFFALLPVIRDSISILSNFAANKYTTADDGTTRSNLRISAQLFDSQSAIAIMADIHNVAAIVLTNVRPSPSNISELKLCFFKYP